MHQTDRIQHHISQVEKEVIDTVEVKPNSLAALHVGIYETIIPIPQLHVTVKPDVGELLSATLERKEEGGDYTLTYLFHNYGDEMCKVTVWSGINVDRNMV